MVGMVGHKSGRLLDASVNVIQGLKFKPKKFSCLLNELHFIIIAQGAAKL